nr:UDP-galactopyranose mutase [uncultured Blautia sp.]
MKYIIIGTGLTGCVIAEQLSQNPDNMIYMIEKKRHIGGTCYDHYNQDGILVHEYGPHIFNTYDQEVWDYVNEFTPFIEYFHRVLGYVDGQLVPIPFNLVSIEKIFPKAMAERMTEKLLDKYGYNTKVPILELHAQNDADLQYLADFVYEKVFLHYTMKQWGMKPDEVGGKAMARIPVYVSTDDRYFQNPYQGVPAYGYTAMMEKMISKKNIVTLTGLDYQDVISLDEKAKKVLVNGQEFDGKVIFTACIDKLMDYKFGNLPYRSLKFEFTTLDKEEYQPVATVNYPCNYEFTRITEFKKLTMQKHPKTTIMKEFSTLYNPDDDRLDPLYPIPQKENEELYDKYLNSVKEYPQIVLAGRLANYKYFTMAETIRNALDIVKSELL